MTFPHGETVTRVRATPGGYDQYGDPLPGTASEVDIPGCAFAPRSHRFDSEQTEPGRRAVTEHITLYAPAGTDIQPADLIAARGNTYRVDGETGDWRSPFTSANRGIEVALIRIDEGAA